MNWAERRLHRCRGVGASLFRGNSTEWFRQGCQIHVPIGDQLTKCFVINQANIEIVSTTVDDGPNGLMEVGLIQVGAVPTLKVFPTAGVDFVFAVYPQLGSVHAIERRFVEKIFYYEFIIFIIV